MSLYRSNLDLRISPCATGDKVDLLLDRHPAPPRGISVVKVRDADAVVAAVRRLMAADWPARGLFPDQDIQNRRVMAWADSADVAPLVAPLSLTVATRRPWRGLWFLAWPAESENFARDWQGAGTDQLEAFAEILPSRADVAEKENAIGASPPEGRLYGLRLTRGLEPMLASFDRGRAFFLRSVFSSARPAAAEQPFLLDREEAERNTGASAGRIHRALGYLADNGWLELCHVVDAMEPWRTGRRKKLFETVSWLEAAECRWRGWLRRAGELRDRPCGHCDWCRGKRTAWLH